MLHENMPAPCEGAGKGSVDLAAALSTCPPPWADEITNWSGLACDYAARRALNYAELAHDCDCDDRGLPFPHEIRERCANPLLLLRFLPHGVTEPVRREAERLLRAW